MSNHAKPSEAPSTSGGAAPARSPDSANTASAQASSAAAKTRSRHEPTARGAALEAIGFWALILVYIWRIEPAATIPVRLVCLVLLGLIPITSLVLHRDHPGDIGLGFKGLRRSALEVGATTLAGALLMGTVAAAMGSRSGIAHHEPLLLPGYFVWGFLQQTALQAFVHRRLRRALGRPRLAEIAAALLFGSLHLPNPILAPAATLGGWVWCRLYSRTPSLWTLAASHAVLAALVLWVVPPAWVHNLKVGPGYWSWR